MSNDDNRMSAPKGVMQKKCAMQSPWTIDKLSNSVLSMLAPKIIMNNGGFNSLE